MNKLVKNFFVIFLYGFILFGMTFGMRGPIEIGCGSGPQNSVTFTPFPLIKGLEQLQEYAKKTIGPSQYKIINPVQQQFFEQYFMPHVHSLNAFNPHELSACVSPDYQVINAFLREKGYEFELPNPGRRGIGVATHQVSEIVWREEGENTYLEFLQTGGSYPAVKMTRTNNFTVYTISGHPHPILCLYSRSGDKIYMTKALQKPENGFLLNCDVLRMRALLAAHHIEDHTFTHAIFPVISLDERVDTSWLSGLGVGGGDEDYAINQVLQQTFFFMDNAGARVKSGFACFAIYRGFSEQETPEVPLLINEPFYLWIVRDGVELPYFCAYLAPDAWKETGD